MTPLTPIPTQAHQILLPGQAAAPDGPIDMAPMYVMHHAFRRDLRDFVAAAGVTPVEDRAARRALAARFEFFGAVLHKHHTSEDEQIWPLLLRRVDTAGDAQGRATLDAMEAEHAEIDPLLTACSEGFRQLAGSTALPDTERDGDARAALEIRLVATRERLDCHLGHEERDAIALIQRYLTAPDWHAVDTRIQQSYTLRESLDVLPWVLHELPAGGRDGCSRCPAGRPLGRPGGCCCVPGSNGVSVGRSGTSPVDSAEHQPNNSRSDYRQQPSQKPCVWRCVASQSATNGISQRRHNSSASSACRAATVGSPAAAAASARYPATGPSATAAPAQHTRPA